MITITAEGVLLEALRRADGPAEVRAPDGTVVGVFTPARGHRPAQQLSATGPINIDKAEVARRKASQKTGRTTREVLERLKTLTQDAEALAHLQQTIDGLAE